MLLQFSLKQKQSTIFLNFRLPYLRPMIDFQASWKGQKTKGFQTFSGGIEIKHLPEMG